MFMEVSSIVAPTSTACTQTVVMPWSTLPATGEATDHCIFEAMAKRIMNAYINNKEALRQLKNVSLRNNARYNRQSAASMTLVLINKVIIPAIIHSFGLSTLQTYELFVINQNISVLNNVKWQISCFA